jgi:hypothetical protein
MLNNLVKHKMRAANTLYFSVTMQRNKNAMFIVFSFSNECVQRLAHYVATVNDEYPTNATIAAVVAAQQKRDNAAVVRDCTSAAVSKRLAKNDARALAAYD